MRAARKLALAYNFTLQNESKLVEDFGDETQIEVETYSLELTALESDSSIEQVSTEENKVAEETKWETEEGINEKFPEGNTKEQEKKLKQWSDWEKVK